MHMNAGYCSAAKTLLVGSVVQSAQGSAEPQHRQGATRAQTLQQQADDNQRTASVRRQSVLHCVKLHGPSLRVQSWRHFVRACFPRRNSNLEGVFLNENQIEAISADLLALAKLKSLWLEGNRIERVENLRSCRLLVFLDLSRNRLAGIASEVRCVSDASLLIATHSVVGLRADRRSSTAFCRDWRRWRVWRRST